jgi:hypothetical protein
MLGVDKKFNSSWSDVLCVMSRLICERCVSNTCVFWIERAARPMSGLDKKFVFKLSDVLCVMRRLISESFAWITRVFLIEQAAQQCGKWIRKSTLIQQMCYA